MKNKLASRLPIQQMIANVIHSATEKVASDEEARKNKVRELVAYEKREHGHIPTPAEEREEHEKTASVSDDYIEKLASAVEFISGNLHTIEFPPQPVLKTAMEDSPQGAGKGPGSLVVEETNTKGRQNYNLGHARNTEASRSTHGSRLSGSHDTDGDSQLDNNMHDAPGNNHGIKPTTRYPDKGPLVNNPTAHSKHASVQSLYQGAVGPKTKVASALRKAVLHKLAGEDVMKANIEAERNADPLAGKGQLESFDSSQAAPHQAGDETAGGYGNQARRLISSIENVINATKRDAKGPVKQQLSELLDEPALNASTDPVLKNNLQNTGKAGVKIAAARTALEKVAQQGCQCVTIDGECAFCRLGEKVAAATQSRGSTKLANMMGSMGGGMGGGAMPPPPAGGMGGGGMGGMTSMADAGAGADGCVCGGTGECRVCKLKAALAAAKAQGGGNGMPAASPVEKDSQGAAPGGGIY